MKLSHGEMAHENNHILRTYFTALEAVWCVQSVQLKMYLFCLESVLVLFKENDSNLYHLKAGHRTFCSVLFKAIKRMHL